MFVVVYGPFLACAYLLGDAGRPGRSFEPYRNQIIISGTSMHYSQSDNTNIISTVGFVRNASPYAWKSLQLEIQYFDGSGRLVDTKTDTLSYQELPPGMTEAFRVRTAAATTEPAYVTNKVFVRTAKDATKILDGN